MKKHFRGSVVLVAVAAVVTQAREWKSIPPIHGFDRLYFERSGSVWKTEINPLFTESPTPAPTTIEPTSMPSSSPSQGPTLSPTMSPTTLSPTSSPTLADKYPAHETPNNPDRWYFNYDTSPTARYGPGHVGVIRDGNQFSVGHTNNQWGLVGNPPFNYWTEFTDDGYGPWIGTLDNRNPDRNMCNRVGMQSPIDVRSSGARCDEFHEVRSLPGDFRVRGDSVFKEIQPNKLRLIYQRRPCADLENVACQEPDPPHADFPNGWGGFADVTHIDFKVPAEHKINGVSFDAEMQIFHIHPGRTRMPTQTVLIQALPAGFNSYFQTALDAFRNVYDTNQALCTNRRRDRRKLVSATRESLGIDDITGSNATDYHRYWAEFSTPLDRPDINEHNEHMKRELQGVWDPHHPSLIPTIHFFRYDGSLTEPPCGEFVSWFVADKPMVISVDQLDEMKKMIFTNVDSSCKPTSVHYNQSVARPIQESANRPVWQCTAADFGPDP